MKAAKRSLRARLAETARLRCAYSEVIQGGNPKSAGPDGITLATFKASWKSQVNRLQQGLRDGTFRLSSGRGVAIPKKGAKPDANNVRPITVFNVCDRIVQRAIANLIWVDVRDHVFSEVSFGGIRSYKVRAGNSETSRDVRKNVAAAARKILLLRDSGYACTFETDIENFFPTIIKEQLFSRLERCLRDSSLNDLLWSAISTTVSNADELEARGLSECWDPFSGVPQGAVLSPLLANLYLADFDKAMIDRGYQMVRYVDDLVILTRSRVDSERAYKDCEALLSELGLRIHKMGEANAKGKVKTKIIEHSQPFEFLGLRINKSTVIPAPSKVDELKSRLKDACKNDDRKTLIEVIGTLNRVLKGWMSAYSFCDIPESTLTGIDHTASNHLAEWLMANRLISNLNSLSKMKRRRLGLWSVFSHEIKPLSQSISAMQSNH